MALSAAAGEIAIRFGCADVVPSESHLTDSQRSGYETQAFRQDELTSAGRRFVVSGVGDAIRTNGMAASTVSGGDARQGFATCRAECGHLSATSREFCSGGKVGSSLLHGVGQGRGRVAGSELGWRRENDGREERHVSAATWAGKCYDDVNEGSQLTTTSSRQSSVGDEGEQEHVHPMMERVRRVRDAAMAASPNDDGEMEHDFMREECGIVGVYGNSEASRLCYLSLHALQHRGQEGAGIVTSDNGALRAVTGMGLVADVFNEDKLKQLPGRAAIGHVRYATSGASTLKNVQPFVAGYRFGSVGIAHNGNLVNYVQLREMLEEAGSIFNTSSDTEVILHLIAKSEARPFILRLINACEQLEGAYSLVFITEEKLVAVRDPYGFRPLVMGRKDDGTVVFASETCALDLIDVTYEREVNPGEVVVVDADGISTMCLLPKQKRQACVFEHVYFGLPNSIIFGRSVYQSRYRFGEILAEVAPVECDVVIAVPDSGVVCALGYAAKAGVPFQQGLIRSHYVGRTFIEPSQKIRDFGVKLKLAPVRAVLSGKRVVVVDDSIVRGTTSSKIVRLLKEAGATEVHMRISSPPITGSCYYGVDTPSKGELISARLTVEETRRFIGADTLAYLPLEQLHETLEDEGHLYCDACFSGQYAVLPRPSDEAALPVDRLGEVAAFDGGRFALPLSDAGEHAEQPVPV